MPASHPVCQEILPIELVSFTADACKENKICLKWETASESENDHYDVERSGDALDFRTVISVPSKAPNGSSHYRISYSCIDESPLSGVDYYRLKQVDKDKSSTYSKIITAHTDLKSGLQFLVYPNYNSGEFTAQITGTAKLGNVIILLRDASGNIVYKALHFVEDISAQLRVVPATKLPAGFYSCTFITDNEEHVMKILVSAF